MISNVATNSDFEAKAIELAKVVSNLPKEMRIVSWKTAKKTKSLIAKSITQELATPQKVVRSKLTQVRSGPTGAEVTLKKTARISLRDFGARQTKKGVSYKVSKTKGRKTIASAFIIKKFGGHVFKRVSKVRTSHTQRYGPSPWGVFVKKQKDNQVMPKVELELHKQLAERLRYQKLKQSGAI